MGTEALTPDGRSTITAPGRCAGTFSTCTRQPCIGNYNDDRDEYEMNCPRRCTTYVAPQVHALLPQPLGSLKFLGSSEVYTPVVSKCAIAQGIGILTAYMMNV